MSATGASPALADAPVAMAPSSAAGAACRTSDLPCLDPSEIAVLECTECARREVDLLSQNSGARIGHSVVAPLAETGRLTPLAVPMSSALGLGTSLRIQAGEHVAKCARGMDVVRLVAA